MIRYIIDTFTVTLAIGIYGYLFGYAVLGMAGCL